MYNNSNKFKFIIFGVFGFFLILGIVAFATYRSSNTNNNTVDITVWGTVNKTLFDKYIDKYKQENNTQFNLTYIYKSIDTIDSELVEAIATNKAPDVILIPHSLEKRYLDKVYMITSIPVRTFKDTFIQEANDLYVQPNGIFALPFFVDPIVMYWNVDMFSSAGIATPPSQWSDFPLLARTFSVSDSNANITKSLTSFGEFQNVNNAKAILSALIIQAGSPIISYSNGTFSSVLDYKSTTDLTIPAESALQFFTDYSNPKKTVYSWNRSLPNSKTSFLSGDMAIYFGFASEYSDIKEKNPNLNFDVTMIPQVVGTQSKKTYGELYGFSFLKNSANVTQAFSLISTLVDANSINQLVNVMDIAPARRDLISSGSSDFAKSTFYNSALISKGWIDPDINYTNQIFKNMVENVTTGKMNVKDSVSNANLELENLL